MSLSSLRAEPVRFFLLSYFFAKIKKKEGEKL